MKYRVKVPIVGYAFIDIEAESAEAAIQEVVDEDRIERDDLYNWTAFSAVQTGGILHTPSATLIDEDSSKFQ